jgi:hypothetical protein|tara:strand:- start:359 stop:679 length:321 start_codon:yes stop_codon:yes gene_type:complete
MFGMLRNLARPIGLLGQKLSNLFSIGRKVRPAGVIIEKVIDTGKPIGGFVKVAGEGADVMNKAGGFVSAGTAAAEAVKNLPRLSRPIREIDYGIRTGADVMRGLNP